MEALGQNLLQLVEALWGTLFSLGALLLPWTPLGAWVAFWLFGVNWEKLRKVMLSGGLIGVLLIGFTMILVWGTIAPPVSADGMHHILGLTLSNFVGKTVYVTSLFVIMFLCGSVQLSGCCAQCCNFADDEAEEPTEHAAH